jgi:tripartite-type tricarboxylate transporter receptor subunit TctC
MAHVVVAKLNCSITIAIGDPGVNARLAAMDIEAVTGTPEEFSAYIVNEQKQWAPIVQATAEAHKN